MKILWLSGNSASYSKDKKDHRGGWIGALESLITQKDDLELAIAFLYTDDCFKKKIGKTYYYPVNIPTSFTYRVMRNLSRSYIDKIILEKVNAVISDFQPDIIHVWGTETTFGLVSKITSIPVVIHIQGLLNPYLNTLFIPGCNKNTFIFKMKNGSVVKKVVNNLRVLKEWQHGTNREIEVFRNCKYFIGRTEWDKGNVSLFSPNSRYFYVSELLRPQFFTADKWQTHNRNYFIFTSIISGNTYKGLDIVLKCSKYLKQFSNILFEWNIYGSTEGSFAEKLSGIKAKDVNVNFCGIAYPDQLIKNLLNSDIYIHPSYIENSPNSLCEAQLLGMPVIANYVGGIPSLIENEINGILIPANDPYLMASKILSLIQSKELCIKFGTEARNLALKRHNPNNIVNDLLTVYEAIK